MLTHSVGYTKTNDGNSLFKSVNNQTQGQNVLTMYGAIFVIEGCGDGEKGECLECELCHCQL